MEYVMSKLTQTQQEAKQAHLNRQSEKIDCHLSKRKPKRKKRDYQADRFFP